MKIPFNIKYKPQIESGEYKVLTNDGSDVRIVCWDAEGSQRKDDIIALVKGSLGAENIQRYYVTGKLIADTGRRGKGLVIVTPEPELTEFEKKVCETSNLCLSFGMKEEIKSAATSLLDYAKEEFIRQGYVIEKKAFLEAVEKVDPEVMKEVSENVDKLSKEELTEFENAFGRAMMEVPEP